MSDKAPTIGSLLKFDFEKPTDEEIEKLRKYGGLVGGAFGTRAGLAQHFWTAAAKNVFRTLATTLDRPLAELLAGGWSKYKPFLEFRDAKRYPPDMPVQKALLKHDISATLTPSVKVLLNGTEVDQIPFQLAAAIVIEAGTLTIQNGRFMSLHGGECTAGATLKCAGKELIKRETEPFDLPGEIRFGEGIPILP